MVDGGMDENPCPLSFDSFKSNYQALKTLGLKERDLSSKRRLATFGRNRPKAIWLSSLVNVDTGKSSKLDA